jgi:hypothetical protein
MEDMDIRMWKKTFYSQAGYKLHYTRMYNLTNIIQLTTILKPQNKVTVKSGKKSVA